MKSLRQTRVAACFPMPFAWLAFGLVFSAVVSPTTARALSYTWELPFDEESGELLDAAAHFDEYFVRYDPQSGWSSELLTGNNTDGVSLLAEISPDGWPGAARADLTIDYTLRTTVAEPYYDPFDPGPAEGSPEEYLNFAGYGSILFEGGVRAQYEGPDGPVVSVLERIVYSPTETGGSVTFSFLLSNPGSYFFYFEPVHIEVASANGEALDPALPAAAAITSEMITRFGALSVSAGAAPVPDEQATGLLLGLGLLGLLATRYGPFSRGSRGFARMNPD